MEAIAPYSLSQASIAYNNDGAVSLGRRAQLLGELEEKAQF